MIDNELVITVRVRIPGELNDGDRATLAGAIAHGAITALTSTGSLSGVELVFPTFEEFPVGPMATVTAP